MAFFTHYCKNGWLSLALRVLCVCGFVTVAGLARAQNSTEILQYTVERLDDEVVVSAQIAFELPAVVEDALLKGIPVFFVIEADVLRERWYWYDKKVASTERHMRLAYQPLTRKWRINVTAGAGRDASVGLTLNQGFETLADALTAIRRVARWKIAETSELDVSIKHKVDFRFRLDLSQLPRPFQIGALGQSDWDLSASTSAALMPTLSK